MAAITLSSSTAYGSLFHAVKDVDLEIADKSSWRWSARPLRQVDDAAHDPGLETHSGEIRIGDRMVNHLPPRDRDIAMVFQNYALYQHMSVYDNLAFGLRNKKTSEAEIKTAIDRARGHGSSARHAGAQAEASCRAVQQQRVALGRCIVRNPQVVFVDEPLSNLDAKLRAQMRIEIKRLHAAIPDHARCS